MPYTSGTATNFKDLLDKLRLYVTDAARGIHQWTQLRYTTGATSVDPDELVLQGPGGGDDAIFVGIRTYGNTAVDYFNWQLYGMDGFEAALPISSQPNVQSSCHVTLWNSNIPYWFVVSGRRIIVVAKISTVYVSAYLGFFNPYATPNQFPYPLAIGGNLAFNADPVATSANWRWSYTGSEMSNFWHPLTSVPMNNQMVPNAGQLKARFPDGSWRVPLGGVSGAYSPAVLSYPVAMGLWPTIGFALALDLRRSAGPNSKVNMVPLLLVGGLTSGITGELDGVFWCSGYQLASEDIVQYNGDDYLIIQNVFRTTNISYVAVRLA